MWVPLMQGSHWRVKKKIEGNTAIKQKKKKIPYEIFHCGSCSLRPKRYGLRHFSGNILEDVRTHFELQKQDTVKVWVAAAFECLKLHLMKKYNSTADITIKCFGEICCLGCQSYIYVTIYKQKTELAHLAAHLTAHLTKKCC